MALSFERVRDVLRRSGFGGLPVQHGAFPSLYARATSDMGGTVFDPNESPPEWAMVSYVKTNSPTDGVGGMPTYVATEVEDVLDALVETGVISNRALWFDVAGCGKAGAAAARVVHCLGAPVICVPPTRTREYSRYQRPDRWDSNTHLALVTLESMLRNCSNCSRSCPDVWDPRLLNVAAALQTWPVADAMLGSVGRGAFISFESFDRYAYTIEWLLVLLQLALESGDYVASLVDKSIELYGHPLFRPCPRCIVNAKDVLGRSGVAPNLKLLEECISQLVLQASRFTLTHSEDRITHNLWTLPGLQRSPGENALWRYTNNDSRFEALSKRQGSSLNDLRHIAAGMLRGRPSEGSCTRHSQKWTAAIILANPAEACTAFSAASSDSSLCKRTYSQVMRNVLQLGAIAFGSFLSHSHRYLPHLHPELRKCKRAPKCTGHKQLCLFSEHSGVVPPSAAVQFLEECFFSREEMARVCVDNLSKIASGLVFARICYIAAWRLTVGKEICCACQPHRRALTESRRLVLLGWDPTLRHGVPAKQSGAEEGKKVEGDSTVLDVKKEDDGKEGGEEEAKANDEKDGSEGKEGGEEEAKANDEKDGAEGKGGSSGERIAQGLPSTYLSPVLAYTVVDAGKMEHVVASGVESLIRGTPTTTICLVCNGTITALEMECSDESLEIHFDQVVNLEQAAKMLQQGIIAAHDIFHAK